MLLQSVLWHSFAPVSIFVAQRGIWLLGLVEIAIALRNSVWAFENFPPRKSRWPVFRRKEVSPVTVFWSCKHFCRTARDFTSETHKLFQKLCSTFLKVVKPENLVTLCLVSQLCRIANIVAQRVGGGNTHTHTNPHSSASGWAFASEEITKAFLEELLSKLWIPGLLCELSEPLAQVQIAVRSPRDPCKTIVPCVITLHNLKYCCTKSWGLLQCVEFYWSFRSLLHSMRLLWEAHRLLEKKIKCISFVTELCRVDSSASGWCFASGESTNYTWKSFWVFGSPWKHQKSHRNEFCRIQKLRISFFSTKAMITGNRRCVHFPEIKDFELFENFARRTLSTQEFEFSIFEIQRNIWKFGLIFAQSEK